MAKKTLERRLLDDIRLSQQQKKEQAAEHKKYQQWVKKRKLEYHRRYRERTARKKTAKPKTASTSSSPCTAPTLDKLPALTLPEVPLRHKRYERKRRSTKIAPPLGQVREDLSQRENEEMVARIMGFQLPEKEIVFTL